MIFSGYLFKVWPKSGKYVGLIDDVDFAGYIWGAGPLIRYDKEDWQKRRVYQDELNYLNAL